MEGRTRRTLPGIAEIRDMCKEAIVFLVPENDEDVRSLVRKLSTAKDGEFIYCTDAEIAAVERMVNGSHGRKHVYQRRHGEV